MKRPLAMLTLTTALVAATGAFAQTMDKNVKIGVLNDQASLYPISPVQAPCSRRRWPSRIPA
jgi:hypothetical protein